MARRKIGRGERGRMGRWRWGNGAEGAGTGRSRVAISRTKPEDVIVLLDSQRPALAAYGSPPPTFQPDIALLGRDDLRNPEHAQHGQRSSLPALFRRLRYGHPQPRCVYSNVPRPLLPPPISPPKHPLRPCLRTLLRRLQVAVHEIPLPEQETVRPVRSALLISGRGERLTRTSP